MDLPTFLAALFVYVFTVLFLAAFRASDRFSRAVLGYVGPAINWGCGSTLWILYAIM